MSEYEKLIIEGENSKLIEKLKATIHFNEIEVDLLSLESRLKILESKKRRGIISDDKIVLEENKINDSFIELVRSLKNKNLIIKELQTNKGKLTKINFLIEKKSKTNTLYINNLPLYLNYLVLSCNKSFHNSFEFFPPYL